MMNARSSCLLFLILLISVSLCCVVFDDFIAPTEYLYQDIVINGQIVQKSERDCTSRYAVVKKFLQQYKRPFTVLDVGANKGYFSLQAAYDFPHGTFVMIEGEAPGYKGISKALLNVCRANTELDNVIFLNKLITSADIIRLSECEHFDVTFAFNILHNLGSENWQSVIDALLYCSDHVIIENPPQEKRISARGNKLRAQIEQHLLEQGGKIVAKVKRHTSDTYASMIIVSRPGGQLKRNNWLRPYANRGRCIGTYVIESDFEHKTLTKERTRFPRSKTDGTYTWLPGINLVTFKMMNGAYPEVATVRQAVGRLDTVETNDWIVSNMVMQGNCVVAIVCDDGDEVCIPFSQKQLEKTWAWLDLSDPKEIEQSYRRTLCTTR